MPSLHARLLLASSLVLAGFLGTTGLALDKAFRVSAKTSLQERLQSHIYTLLAATDADSQGGMIPPPDVPEPRFSKPDSGLYAVIANHSGKPLWRSSSLTGREFNIIEPHTPGERFFHHLELPDSELYMISFGVAWVNDAGIEELYTFAVAEDTSEFAAEIQSFRTTLWGWLGAMALALLLAQGLVLRWGLRPLRTVAHDLQEIEQGRADSLGGPYPRELSGLTSNINSLIEHRDAVQTRYRNSLADLAHSLKTPLAILQTFFDRPLASAAEDRPSASEQVKRMDDIIRHQLHRAAVSGGKSLTQPAPIAPQIMRLSESLDKVYRDKHVSVTLELDPDVTFTGDQADLLEFLGNLMENAYKYSAGKVRIRCRTVLNSQSGTVAEITIEDDGHGIDPGQVSTALQRGKRMDESVPGHGIGLSVANEIIALYDGTLDIESSELGGALLRIHLTR